MSEELKKVINTISTDEDLAKRMGACKSPEEAYELAKTVADGYTLEEFQDVMKKLKDMYSRIENGDITEEELKNVSGGLSDYETAMLVTSTATIGGTVVAVGIAAASVI